MIGQDKQTERDASAIRVEIVSIGKHSSVYFIGQALSRAIGFFMIPIYTKFIAPTNYGGMEMIEILTSCIAMFISMNIADTMPRFYYAEKEECARNQVVSTTILGFSLIGLPIMFLFLWFSEYLSVIILDVPQYKFYLQISVLTVWFSMLCEIIYTYLRMQYMAKTFVAMNIVQLVLALSLNIYFIVFKRLDILGVFYSTLITQSLTALLLTIWVLRKTNISMSISLLYRLIVFGIPVVPSRIGSMLGFVSNRFFLRWLGAADPMVALTQVGLFSLGHKFGVIVNRFINVPFNSFWGPRRLELLISNEPEAKETIARICTYATLGSVYFTVVLSSGIESLIEIMADPSYRGSHLVVPYVALAYTALGLETHFSTGILYQRKTVWLTYISILALVIALAWNYVFIPRYGIYGAATSNLAGFIVRCGLTYVVSRRLYPIPFEIKRIATLFVTAFILYIISQTINLSTPYLTLIGRTGFVALFPFVLFLVGFYTKGELEFVGGGLKKWKKAAGSFYS